MQVFITKKFCDIEGSSELIENFIEPKNSKLFKSKKSKSKKFPKSKKLLKIEIDLNLILKKSDRAC